MLLVKPVTVSHGFSDVVTEVREQLTTDIQTETGAFSGSPCILGPACDYLYYDRYISSKRLEQFP